MSVSCVTFHHVKGVKANETGTVCEGVFAKDISLSTKSGAFVVTLFSSDEKCLEVKR